MGPGFEQVLAHIAGDKLIGTVVVRVQWSDVFANQEGAPLQANIDDQLGGRGRAEQYGREPEERGTHANDFGLDDGRACVPRPCSKLAQSVQDVDSAKGSRLRIKMVHCAGLVTVVFRPWSCRCPGTVTF